MERKVNEYGPAGLGGGVEKERGGFYEDVTLLHYSLWRLSGDPGLEVTLETEEDATFRYSTGIVELIQCKKREKRDGVREPGATYGDYWVKGRYTLADIGAWLEHDGYSVSSALENNPQLFFTALVYGDLNQDLQELVPEKLKNHLPLQDIRPECNLLFPPGGLTGASTSSPALRFTSPGALQRVRVVPTSAPGNLEPACERLLEGFFRVAYPRARGLVRVLLDLIRRCSLSREDRTIPSGKIARIIGESRSSRGAWKDARAVMQSDHAPLAAVAVGLLPSWSEMESGKFVKRREYDEAAKTLVNPGSFINISGAVGSGKSMFCRYLAFKFLRESPQASAFFLFPSLGVSTAEECTFLEQNLDQDALFIIEDQHLASGEVDQLIEAFLAGQVAGKRCRLVLTSKVNYGHTEGLAGGLATKDLRNAFLYALPNRSEEEVEALLAGLRPLGLSSRLSDRQLAEISGGVIGVAVLVARSTPPSRSTQSREQWSRGGLKNHLAVWIWRSIGKREPVDEVYFRDEIASPFVLGAFGLSVTKTAFRAVPGLVQAGLFEEYEDPLSGSGCRPSDLNLAFLIQDQYRELHHALLAGWARDRPEALDIVMQKAANYDPAAVPSLFIEFKTAIIAQLIEGQSARASARILRLLRGADRTLSNEIFRSWIAPGNAPNLFFWSEAVNRATTAGELAALLDVIARYDASGHGLSDLEGQLGEQVLESTLILITDPRNEIDQIGRCLQAIRRCSFEFGARVYGRWVNTELCKEHLRRVADQNLSRLLRYLDQVVPFDRLGAYQAAESLFPASRMSALLLGSHGVMTAQIALLSRLGRLHPLLAARGLAQAARDGRARIASGLRADDTVDRITQDLYLLAAVNRRHAVSFAYEVLDRLLELIGAETNYAVAGGRIESVRRNISTPIAERMAHGIDRNSVLASLEAERRHIDKVGKFLHDLSLCDRELAAFFESRLSLIGMLQITRAPRLRDLVLAIRGFLVAAPQEQQTGGVSRHLALQREFIENASLRKMLADRRKGAKNLSEIGFAVGCLMDCNLSKLSILRMLGFANYREFSADLELRARKERSAVHVAAGLYGVAFFDLGLAEAAARAFVETSGSSPSTLNLVDLGCLLQALAAIDPHWARKVVRAYKPERLTALCAKERNLGRVAVILTSLSQCSYSMARRVTTALTREANWKQLYRSNENFNALSHFVNVLRRVAPRDAASFVDYVITHHSPEVLEFLRVQASLAPVAQWLRIGASLDPVSNRNFLAALVTISKETIEFDTNFRHLLDVAEGLLAIRQIAASRELVDKTLPMWRIRSIRQLSMWLVIVSKVLHIARRSSHPSLASTVLSEMEAWHLELLVLSEPSRVVAALSLRLLRSETDLVPEWCQELAGTLNPRLIKAILADPNSITKVLSLLLCRGHANNILAALQGIVPTRTWEVGLLSLLILERSDRNLTDLLTRQARNIFEADGDALTKAIPDLPTMELILSVAAADLISDNNGFRESALREIEQRTLAEGPAGVQWLLTRVKSYRLEIASARVLLSIFQETIMRSTYLPWRSDLEQLVDDAAFDQIHRRNELNLLSDVVS